MSQDTYTYLNELPLLRLLYVCREWGDCPGWGSHKYVYKEGQFKLRAGKISKYREYYISSSVRNFWQIFAYNSILACISSYFKIISTITSYLIKTEYAN